MKIAWMIALTTLMAASGLALAPEANAGHYGHGHQSHGPAVRDVHLNARHVQHRRIHRAGPAHRYHPPRHGHYKRFHRAGPKHRHYRPSPGRYHRAPPRVIYHAPPPAYYPPRSGVTIHFGY